MTIGVVCTSCEAKLKAPDDWAGKKVACPKCKTAVQIPAAASASSPAASPESSAPAPKSTATVQSTPATAPRPKAAPSAPHDSDEELFQAVIEGRAPVVRPPSKPAPNPANPAAPKALKDEAAPAKPTSKGAPATAAVRNETALNNLRQKRALLRPEWLAWLWLLLFVPLIVYSFMPNQDIFQSLLEQVSESPELAEKLELLESSGEGIDRTSLLNILPGKKLRGALLSSDSLGHWGFAVISALFYAVLIQVTFRFSSTHIGHAAAVAIFTGTAGVLLLLGLQAVAMSYMASGMRVRGGGVIGLVIQLVLAFIAFSYRCAMDPDLGFVPSLFGFTFGVGLCEEFCKALPIVLMLRSYRTLGWRGAAIWGLASGVGFGLSEAIMYSGSMYNGLLGPGIYWVRFLSCVGLHSMWAATVAIFMWRGRDEIEAAESAPDFAVVIGKYMFLAMLLHGLYDTLLKADMDLLALLVAIASFFIFIFVMHNTQAATRGEEFADIF